jgi:hypothetical protein
VQITRKRLPNASKGVKAKKASPLLISFNRLKRSIASIRGLSTGRRGVGTNDLRVMSCNPKTYAFDHRATRFRVARCFSVLRGLVVRCYDIIVQNNCSDRRSRFSKCLLRSGACQSQGSEFLVASQNRRINRLQLGAASLTARFAPWPSSRRWMFQSPSTRRSFSDATALPPTETPTSTVSIAFKRVGATYLDYAQIGYTCWLGSDAEGAKRSQV